MRPCSSLLWHLAVVVVVVVILKMRKLNYREG